MSINATSYFPEFKGMIRVSVDAVGIPVVF